MLSPPRYKKNGRKSAWHKCAVLSSRLRVLNLPRRPEIMKLWLTVASSMALAERLRLRRFDAFLLRVSCDLLCFGQLLLKLLDFLHVFLMTAPERRSSVANSETCSLNFCTASFKALKSTDSPVPQLAAEAPSHDQIRGPQSKHQAACFHVLFHSWFK